MNKKYLIAVFSFVAVSLTLLFAAFWYVSRQEGLNVRGNYFFEMSKENIHKISHLKIISDVGHEINLYYNDGVWRFKEAADYFASPEAVANFYKMLNSSVIVLVEDGNEGKFAEARLNMPQENGNLETFGTVLQVFDDEDKMIDNVIIGKKASKDDLRYVRRVGKDFVYAISDAEKFSGAPSAWVPYPLLNVDLEFVKYIEMNNKSFDLETLGKRSLEDKQVWDILSIIKYIEYDGVAFRKDFFEEYPDAKSKQIKVRTSIGLVYVLDVYWEDETYWLKVTLDTGRIFYKDVSSFVTDNQRFFADWVFQLNDRQGKLLYESRNW